MKGRVVPYLAVVLISASVGAAFSAWRFLWLFSGAPGLGISHLTYMVTTYVFMTTIVGLIVYSCVDVVRWLLQAGLSRQSLIFCGWMMLVVALLSCLVVLNVGRPVLVILPFASAFLIARIYVTMTRFVSRSDLSA
jgi:hypothetical protein